MVPLPLPGRWIVPAIVPVLVAQIVHGLATNPFFEGDRFPYWFPRPTILDGPHITPGGFDAFADTVVPLFQERGVFRTKDEGTTLRDHLGLAHPDTAGTGDGRVRSGAAGDQLTSR